MKRACIMLVPFLMTISFSACNPKQKKESDPTALPTAIPTVDSESVHYYAVIFSEAGRAIFGCPVVGDNFPDTWRKQKNNRFRDVGVLPCVNKYGGIVEKEVESNYDVHFYDNAVSIYNGAVYDEEGVSPMSTIDPNILSWPTETLLAP